MKQAEAKAYSPDTAGEVESLHPQVRATLREVSEEITGRRPYSLCPERGSALTVPIVSADSWRKPSQAKAT
jgi:hypothetical protein